jgi:hypothetical protein
MMVLEPLSNGLCLPWSLLFFRSGPFKESITIILYFQARFQAKQLVEKEEKLINLLEEKQVSTLALVVQRLDS